MVRLLKIKHSPIAIFFFTDTAPTEIYTLSLHDALPISWEWAHLEKTGSFSREKDRVLLVSKFGSNRTKRPNKRPSQFRSEEHTSELQSPDHLACLFLLEKTKTNSIQRRKRIASCANPLR